MTSWDVWSPSIQSQSPSPPFPYHTPNIDPSLYSHGSSTTDGL